MFFYGNLELPRNFQLVLLYLKSFKMLTQAKKLVLTNLKSLRSLRISPQRTTNMCETGCKYESHTPHLRGNLQTEISQLKSASYNEPTEIFKLIRANLFSCSDSTKLSMNQYTPTVKQCCGSASELINVQCTCTFTLLTKKGSNNFHTKFVSWTFQQIYLFFEEEPTLVNFFQ